VRAAWLEFRILGTRLLGLRALQPIDGEFGANRGTPIDRYYIEGFLCRNAGDIAGRVMEIGEDVYTRRFGGAHVSRCDILHIHEGNPAATIVGDLTDLPQVPSNSFNAIICTQTMQYILDPRAAAATLHRLLKPGGVLLCTVPGITMVHGGEWGATWYWSFTDRSVSKLFGEEFGETNIEVEIHGNVLAATEFLCGRVTEEMRKAELDVADRRFPVILALRARKATES